MNRDGLAQRRAKLRQRREALSAEKQAQLQALLKGESAESNRIPARDVNVPAPLSFAQQRLWVLDQIDPGRPTYNIPMSVHLKGQLDVAALTKAFDTIVARHDVLRTTFRYGDEGEPYQHIDPDLRIAITHTDLSQLNEADRQNAIQHHRRQAALQTFDLATDPLIVIELLHCGNAEFWLLITKHHIISDGWSFMVLLQEMSQLYRAYSQDRSLQMTPLPTQFADYAAWQRNWLEGKRLEKQIDFWRDHLSDAPALHSLPTDYPRPPVQTFSVAQHKFKLGTAMRMMLQQVSSQAQTTLYTTLLTVFAVLLKRASRQDNIVIGSAVANRNHPDLEGLIGFFVNMLSLNVNLEGNPTFAELLQRVHQTSLATQSHQDVPFDRIVEALNPERDLSHSPIFQIAFVMQTQNRMTNGARMGDLEMAMVEQIAEATQYDLVLDILEGGNELICSCNYNTDLFSAETVARWMDQYNRLLEGIVADQNRPITDYNILADDERQHLLYAIHNQRNDRDMRFLHELVAAADPDTTAVIEGQRSITFGELNARANQLAHALQAVGMGPESVIGVGLPRTLDQVVATLACLKAGAGYLGIDPNLPIDRTETMVAGADISVIISANRWYRQLPSTPHLILLDGDAQMLGQQPTTAPDVSLHAQNLAYLIYTSGSTGKPKGVQVQHGGIRASMSETRRLFGIKPGERMTYTASISFDASVLETWSCLTGGATFVVCDEPTRSDPELLKQFLIENRITISFAVTPIAELLLLETDWPEDVALHTVVTGGDALRVFPHDKTPFRLLNNYGPSECSVLCTSTPVAPRKPNSRLNPPPIGYSLDDAYIFIVDEALRPVPIGVAGELLIGGDIVGRGYRHRPDLTAMGFVPNPFRTPEHADQPQVLYRTGDLVRYLEDGNIEFIGRIDHQVQIRGFRIELGEIEAILSDHEDVREVLVLVHGYDSNKQLVAFVAGSAESGDLRAHLSSKVPTYMVPHHFIMLDALPLTTNGKIDRRELQRLADTQNLVAQRQAEYVPLVTETEQKLGELWLTLLSVEQVGRLDNFFDLGGHSLLATRLLSRIRRVFGVEVAFRSVFEHQTLAQLATVIDSSAAAAHLPPIEPVDRSQPLPLSFAQQRLWVLEQLTPGTNTYSVPFALVLEGVVDGSALAGALGAVVARHESLRSRILANADGEPITVIDAPQPFPLPEIDVPNQAAALDFIRADLARPFDLENGPLIHGALFVINLRKRVLYLNMHHIVSDGWSINLFLAEMMQIYPAMLANKPSPLPPLEIQYVDYAAWQRQNEDVIFGQQLAFWQDELDQLPALSTFPLDHQRPIVNKQLGAEIQFEISAENSKLLRAFSRQQSVTPFSTLLAVYSLLLARVINRPDVAIGTPVANRNHLEIEPLVGFFVNTLVVRNQIDPNATFFDLVQQTHNGIIQAQRNQDVPYERVVDALLPERDLTISPLFQTMFSLVEQAIDFDALTDIEISSVPLELSSAKFDMNWMLSDLAGRLIGQIEYNTDLYDEATVTRLMGLYHSLLDRLLAQPETTIWDMPLLSADESADMWHHHPGPDLDIPQQALHELVEAQVERTPDASAVVFGDTVLTYAQLNQQANQLAHHLLAQGVNTGDLVAVCVPRSAEMVIALLGCLKAGAAYVPIDPTYPSGRIQHMLDDSQATIVLTLHNTIPPESTAQAVDLTTILGDGVAANPALELEPDAAAYAIYTSGSTGLPKGSVISHANIVNHMTWMQNEFGYTAADVVVQKTPFSFDASVWEFYAPLLIGGTLIVAEPDGHKDSAYMCDLIQTHGATIIQFVPSLLQMMLLDPDFANCTGLRHIFCGGEALSAELIKQCQSALPSAQLTNLYGPSEATIDSSFWMVPPAGSDLPPRIPIGQPIANGQMVVLDSAQNILPVGLLGELCVVGAGVGKGYWNRPTLSAERFINHPNYPHSLLYRTGDLGRRLADGTIEYWGRLDNQVKLRGYRIELGEIETALLHHDAIQQCAVLVERDNLVAFIVPTTSEVPTGDLRSALQTQLPDFMVPSAFSWLDEMPFTPSGKIDRKALAKRAESADIQVERSAEYVEPTTETEATLADFWVELLPLEKVGRNDNFFELGGHSLTATRLLTRIRRHLDSAISLRSLFENQTLRQMAHAIDDAAGGGWQTTIQKLGSDEPRPLSFAQRRLWILDALLPDRSMYSLPTAIRLQGRVDVAALSQAIGGVVERHEVLRSRIATQPNGDPIAIIQPHTPFDLSVKEVASLAAAHDWILEQNGIPFDLQSGPLIRVLLLKLGTNDHILYFNQHHIVTDGWSISVMLNEVSQLYAAFVMGQPSPLPSLPIQYADYAAQQHASAETELADQLAYWHNHLDDVPPLSTFPLDYGRSAENKQPAAIHEFSLSAETSQRIRRLSRRHGSTPFSTLLAIYNLLLARANARPDVAVGTPVANREQLEVEGLLGFFVNTLVMRSQIDPQMTFADLIAATHNSVIEGQKNQAAPFDRVVDAVLPERDLAISPVFQTMFAVQDALNAPLNLPDLQLTELQTALPTAKFDMSWSLIGENDVYHGHIEYNADLFDPATVARYADLFVALVERLSTNTHQIVWDMPLLSAETQTNILEQAQGKRLPIPSDCLHQLIEWQTTQTPHEIALVAGDQRLTYAALNSRANQLANYLVDQHVAPGDLVAICAERSVEMVVGLLAILKVGGGYLPIDPNNPTERISYMLADSQAKLLLVQDGVLADLPTVNTPIVALNADVAAFSAENLDRHITPEDLAYVIYTSGSTGKPKGSTIRHRNIVNHMLWTIDTFDLDDSDVMLQKTPFSFDAAVWEFYAPLIVGGTLVMAEPGGHRDSAYTADVIQREGVTIIQFVPTLLQMMVHEPAFANCDSLRHVFCGGEALSAELVRQFYNLLPHVQLNNLYGPSECSIDSTYWMVPNQPNTPLTRIPIGRAIANTSALVLDHALNVCPIGFPGELHVGGAGVGSGYLHKPDLTTEKFIASPFDKADILYKTGDGARLLADGNIDYLGRLDTQVKVRGYRVELGEVENALLTHPAIQTAAVIVENDRLLAFVVAEDGELPATQLRENLAASLPDYMVPANFSWLPHLPHTPNGKIDRRALARLAKTTHLSGIQQAYVAPETQTEQRLAAIWQQVLNVQQVGRNDNFFDLGGHSLLATRLMAHVRREFGVAVPLRALFERQTLAAFATAIHAATQTSDLPLLTPIPHNETPPLSFAQQRLWVLDQIAPGRTTYSMPSAVRLTGQVDVAALAQALNDVVARHAILRSRVGSNAAGEPVSVIESPSQFALPLLEASSDEDAQAIIQADLAVPFDLATGPLLRAKLIKLSDDNHILYLNQHHIISDGWSIGVLLDEIGRFYAAHAISVPHNLPPLTLQYGDYAAWQRRHEDAIFADQLGYWQNELADLPTLSTFPTERQRPLVSSNRGSSVGFELSAETTEKLRQLSRDLNTTPTTILLAAYSLLLGKINRHNDVAVGIPVANRQQIEVEQMVGFFVNTAVIRSTFDLTDSFADLIDAIQQRIFKAQAHQDVPFERIVDAILPKRDLSITPLFQTMFTFDEVSDAALNLPNLTLSPVEIGTRTSKFDMVWGISGVGDAWRGGVEFNVDLYSADTVTQFTNQFKILLDDLLADPAQPVWRASLLSPTTAHTLTVERNRWPSQPSPVDYLSDVVLDHPAEKVALISGNQQWTYGELNAKANQIAHELAALNVEAESIVGIGLKRSADYFIVALGILRAGAAFTSLDPSLPAERLATINSSANLAAIITDAAFADLMPTGTPLLLLNDLSEDGVLDTPQVERHPDQLAYLIYTSGSTGVPKGVQISHRGLHNALTESTRRFALSADDIMTQVASTTFDASVWEMGMCFANGATLLIPNDEVRMDATKLQAWLVANAITFTFAPTPIAELLLTLPWPVGSALRMVITGGDALKAIPADATPFTLVNNYGPSECSIVTTGGDIPPAASNETPPDLGTAFEHVTHYVVDEFLQPVPDGVPGELLLGGPQVGRGYRGAAGLSAERFIPNPFRTDHSPDQPSRLYRTGDLVRVLPTGRLAFLGRIDTQIKIRGLRIELGEIEAVLNGHESVQNGIVLVLGDDADKRLIGFAVARDSAESLRSHLATKLPTYMVPQHILLLDAMPLTTNGKFDRRALEQLALEADFGAENAANLVPVETHTERTLAKIWTDILPIDTIGRFSNFFDLGGHSLLITRLLGRIRKEFSVEVNFRDVFEQQTVAALATAIDQAAMAAQLPPIEPVDSAEPQPLSFAQQRMWVLDQLNPGRSTYNIPIAVRLQGGVDVAALRNALTEVVARHSVLRSRVGQNSAGEPISIIDDPTPFDLPLLTAHNDTEARQLIMTDLVQSFDLAQGPLFRGMVVELADNDHILYLNQHHIISDGWSMNVLLREVGQLYASATSQTPSTLPRLPIQYGDYAAWQRSHEAEIMGDQLAYWLEELDELAALSTFPTDGPRPQINQQRGSTLSFELSAEITQKIRQLSREQLTTPFTTLISTFTLLLGKLNARPDVAVGIPVANRQHADIEDLIGFFVNTAVIRNRYSNDDAFVDLLGQMHRRLLTAQRNQDVPFERVVDALLPERDLSQTPLFQTMFTLEESLAAPASLPGLTLQPLELDSQTAKFDMVWSLAAVGDSLQGTIEFNVDLFSAETVTTYLNQFLRLLDGILADPTQAVWRYGLLSPKATHALVVEKNRWPTPLADVNYVSDAVARHPADKTALVSDSLTLTYGELNHRANQLAHKLIAKGAGPEKIVGIGLPRSAEFVVAALAVLRSGAAYIAFDPKLPAERLSYMAERSKLAAIVSDGVWADQLPTAAPVVFADAIELDDVATLPDVQRHPDQLAYCIFTSGSTGQPKGVQVSHRGLSNTLTECQRRFGLSAADRMTQIASSSFDASVWETWMCLHSGSTLFVADDETRLDADLLFKWLLENKISVSFTPTPITELLLDYAWPTDAAMRLILTGGDALRKRPSPQAPFVLMNNYGPSECAIVTAMGPISADSVGVPDLGFSVPQVGHYIVDEHLNAVPFGVPGELLLGGPQVGRGYRDAGGLSAERFIPNPFRSAENPEQPSRLYRTGDLVRYLPNGKLAFLGRIDQQVKIRGLRIELGEIEAVLQSHANVAKTIVLVHGDGLKKQLIAFVVGSDLVETHLASHLSQRLPSYMVPSRFVTLDSLPLTVNGKIDRRALLAQADYLASESKAATFVAATTATEEKLAMLWADILQQERIGIYENFFELGGHSLLATRLASRIRRAFSIEMPLRTLFEFPTVAQLAVAIERLEKSQQLAPIERVPDDQPLQLSYAQQRMWTLEQLEPGRPAYNVPIGFRIDGPLFLDAFSAAWNGILQRHDALRTTFSIGDGTMPVQVVHEHRDVMLTVTNTTESEIAARAIAEATKPFDLEQGPLWRVNILRLTENAHVVLVTMHHIISDNWSLDILLNDLGALYMAAVMERPANLPELPIRYADFAAWQRLTLDEAELNRQMAFWRDHLAGAPQTIDLPTDYPRPLSPSFKGTTYSFELSAENTTSLDRFAQQHNATPFMTYLALFNLLLSRYTGETDIVVGTPIANRQRQELEGLVGFFLNTLVLRTQIDAEAAFGDLLKTVRSTMLAAQANQDLPFEKLVDALQLSRDTSRTPLFQVLFVLQQNRPNAGGSELSFKPLDVKGQSSKFDLTLFVIQDGDRWTATIEYSTDLFKASTIQRMAKHFEQLLGQVAGAIEAPLHQHQLLTINEQTTIQQWNDTQTEFAHNGALHALFEQQAKKTPQAIALEVAGESLTYADLEKRANRVAAGLQRLGLEKNVPVGVCLGRSAELYISILGILKAGGCYMPLDPAYPDERLSYMLADSGAPLLIADAPVGDGAMPFVQVADLEAAGVVKDPQTNGDDLLFLIYTSGSTGQPKGVAMRHEPLTNLVQWQQSTTMLRHPARTAQFSAISFDVSCQELFFTWHSGGTLVVVPEETRRDSFALLAWLRERQVERLFLPFIALQQLAEAATTLDDAQMPITLQEVITAGEQLQATSAIRSLFMRLGATLHNQYGPTETHVATAYQLPSDPEKWHDIPPIGTPVANGLIRLLDAELRRVPVGIAGEIYIGGDILAQGYYGKDELSAERFIPDPFSSGRLYKTGDLGRYQVDGNIEYWGRNDFQVKVRGFRIELGEVESALTALDDVTAAAVAAIADAQGNNQLVAYVVGEAEMHAVKQTLNAKLPAYMVPSRFVALDQLPLTPSGKIDRRALPHPQTMTKISAERELVAPRDAVEGKLAAIWQKLLGVAPIGVEDDFFALGGHSLLAVQVATEVRRELDYPLSPLNLFTHPTIGQLASLLRADGAKAAYLPLVPIRPAGDLTPLFLVHAGGGHVQPYVALTAYVDGNRPIYGLQARLSPPLLKDIPTMAKTYLEAIRSIQPEGPYLLGGWSMGGSVALEMAHQLETAGESVEQLILIDTTPPQITEQADEVGLLITFARDLGLTMEQLEAEEWEATSVTEALDQLIGVAMKRGVLPPQTAPEVIHQLFAVFEANYNAALAYQPANYTGNTLLLTAEDGDAEWVELWKEKVDGLVFGRIPGDHFSILREPNLQTLADHLNSPLNQTNPVAAKQTGSKA